MVFGWFKGVSPGCDNVFFKIQIHVPKQCKRDQTSLACKCYHLGILSGGFVDYRASFIEDFRYENIYFGWENHWIPKNFTVKSRSSSPHLSYYICFCLYESKDPGNERISSFRYGFKKLEQKSPNIREDTIVWMELNFEIFQDSLSSGDAKNTKILEILFLKFINIHTFLEIS